MTCKASAQRVPSKPSAAKRLAPVHTGVGTAEITVAASSTKHGSTSRPAHREQRHDAALLHSAKRSTASSTDKAPKPAQTLDAAAHHEQRHDAVLQHAAWRLSGARRRRLRFHYRPARGREQLHRREHRPAVRVWVGIRLHVLEQRGRRGQASQEGLGGHGGDVLDPGRLQQKTAVSQHIA
jgi:hypothetical protein